jgi:hypothetical protein
MSHFWDLHETISRLKTRDSKIFVFINTSVNSRNFLADGGGSNYSQHHIFKEDLQNLVAN